MQAVTSTTKSTISLLISHVRIKYHKQMLRFVEKKLDVNTLLNNLIVKEIVHVIEAYWK